jgi:hypothetical protein
MVEKNLDRGGLKSNNGKTDVASGGFVLSSRVADKGGVFSKSEILAVCVTVACPGICRPSVFPLRCAGGENFSGIVHGFGFDALESVASVFVHIVACFFLSSGSKSGPTVSADT